MISEETKQKIADLADSLIQCNDPFYRSCRGESWWTLRERPVSDILELISRKMSIAYELDTSESVDFVENSIRFDCDAVINAL